MLGTMFARTSLPAKSVAAALLAVLLLAWLLPGLAPRTHAHNSEHWLLVPGEDRPMDETAARHNVPATLVAHINGLSPTTVLSDQHLLIVPLPGAAAIVETFVPMIIKPAFPGQTLAMLAEAHGMPVDWLSAANSIAQDQRLFPGQPMFLPDLADPRQPRALGQVTVEYLSPYIGAGQTGYLLLSSNPGIQPSAQLGDTQLHLTQVPHPEAKAQQQFHYSPIPIDPLTESGPVTVTVSYLSQAGDLVAGELRIEVFQPGPWRQEIIVVDGAVAARLSVEALQEEANLLTATWNRRNLPRQWSNGPWQRPIPEGYPTTSVFGSRREYRSPVPIYATFHTGLDWAAPIGEQVTAPVPGTVALAEELITKGLAVVLDHGQGVLSGYWHLSEISVEVGDFVEAGDLVGLIGSSGISSGSHLHWEVRIHGVPVNPRQFLYGSILPPETPE